MQKGAHLPGSVRLFRRSEKIQRCLVNACLYRLNYADRKFASLLNCRQQWPGFASFSQCAGKHIRRSHCILNSKINTGPSGGRHNMSSISDAEQSRLMPLLQTIDLNRKQLHLFPVFDFFYAAPRNGAICSKDWRKAGSPAAVTSSKVPLRTINPAWKYSSRLI